ncbi:C40 family peptidase [Shouchella shacheensis]|uniref:C40 family peptidase n=1 Tax=Shouchella shacheensis TaxID=1649580 RepID=UPI00073FF7DB|nr:NlpC/P60 family protein [Shouchella shacheensis]
MFKANVKKLVVRTSVLVGLAASATLATNAEADASVDMSKVNDNSNQSASTESDSTETAQSSNSSNENTSSPVVRRGDSGSAVQNVQANVGAAPDGVFGPETESKVRAFQAENGLPVTGVAAELTHAAFDGQASAPASNNATSTTEDTVSASEDTASVSEGSSSESSSASTASVEQTQEVSTQVAGAQVSSGASGDVLSTARSQVGAPYVWGGTTPAGFDCSGFINYAFAADGVSLPRTAQGIYNSASTVSNPSPGDIVFFEGTYSTSAHITHAGIYLGGGDFVHAASNGVEVSNLDNVYWSQHYVGAGAVN